MMRFAVKRDHSRELIGESVVERGDQHVNYFSSLEKGDGNRNWDTY